MKRWNRRNKAMLLENLEMYMSSGLNLHEAMLIISRSFSKAEATAVLNVKILIEKGQTLSKGFENNINLSHNKNFLTSYCRTIGYLL